MKRILTLIVILSATILSASAADVKSNILNSIQIDSLNNTYSITLNSLRELDVKRTEQSPDDMILTLKNVKPAKSLNTIYRNAAEVNSIMVEPVGENNLNIIIKAKNISNAAVSTSAEETELQASNNKSVLTPKKQKKAKKDIITLASPITAYMPVYEEDIEEIDSAASFIPSFGFIEKIKSLLTSGNNSNIITTGLVGLIILCSIKLFKKEEKEPVIGLTQSLKEREMNLYKDLALTREAQMTNSMQQNNLRAPLPKTNINANAGYGMKAYQSSSRNPYMSSDIVTRRAGLNQTSASVIKPQPKVMSTVGSRVNQTSSTMQMRNLNKANATPSNIDSIKFLESMTKIYEKNGRSDLAQGLKSGMLKAQK